MELLQETEDVLRLGLIQLRINLRKAATQTMTKEEETDWEKEEYRLKAQLTELEMWLGLQGSKYGAEVAPAHEEGQTSEEVSERGTKESGLLLKALKVMSLMQSDQANRGEDIPAEVAGDPISPATVERLDISSFEKKLDHVVSTLQTQEITRAAQKASVEKPVLSASTVTKKDISSVFAQNDRHGSGTKTEIGVSMEIVEARTGVDKAGTGDFPAEAEEAIRPEDHAQ